MIDDLLEELEAAGRVDSEGEFTLDRAKAREKLQRFQLADPRAYVLELVQAASLKGATAVRFQVDSRDMVMELDGRPFTTTDFDDIYGAALTRRLDHDVLARRQLAIGLGSAMALMPRFIAVESGDGKTGARLLMQPEAEDEFEAIETARVGTRIHVRERFTMGTFAAFFRNLAGTLAEEQLLRARCGYASFGIDLEGTRIDQGLTFGDWQEVLEAVELSGEHVRGLCGLRESGSTPATVRIIKDGVWIADHELPTDRFPGCFVAIVQDHALRKDVSQSDIVRDAAYEALVGVLEQGSWRALAALVGRLEAGTAPPWADRELMRQVHLLAVRGTLRIVEEPTGLVRALRRLPLWRTTEGRALCLDELAVEAGRAGSIAFTSTSAFRGVVLPERAFVVLLPAASADPRQAILTAHLGLYLYDVTHQLEALVRREQARKAWLARPTAPVLPEGAYQCRRAFEGPGVRGELGIVADRSDVSSIVLVVDGCLLVEQPLSVPWLGLRMVVAAACLQPNERFDGIVPTAEACTAILHAATEIPALYGELAGVPPYPWRDACAMSFLEATLRGDSLALVLGHAFVPPGQPDRGRAAAIEAFGRSRLVLDPRLHARAPHPTVRMPLYRTVDPRRSVSLHEIIERARRGEPIMAVADPKVSLEADILVLDAEDRALLQPLLARPIEDGAAEVARIQREREFLNRPFVRTVLDAEPPAVVVPIEGDGISGALRVVPKPGTGVRTIQVLHRQRALDTLQLVMVGEASGWVEAAAAMPTVDYRYVKQDAALYQVRAAVLRAFATACLRVAEHARAGATPELSAFLLEVLALPFPGAMRAAFDNLWQDQGSSMQLAAEEHEQLYAELHVQRTAGLVEDRVARLARSKTPLADVRAKRPPTRTTTRWALAAVDVLFPSGAHPQDLPGRVLRPAAPLAELPLLRHHDGRPLTLATIREAIDRGQALGYVQALASIDVPDRTIALVDATQIELLRRVVGGGRVFDGTAIIEQIRRRQQLDARAKVERVALAPGAALVSVRLGDAREPRLEGEVGLPVQHHGDPHQRARMRLWAHVERAPIEVIELDDRPVHVVAAASDDRLLLSSDHKAVVRNEALRGLVAECEACVPALVVQLASRWDRLDPAVRPVAWYHLLDFLVDRRPPSLDRWASGGVTEEAFAKAAAVPGFTGAGGVPLSAADLVRAYQRHRRTDVLPAPHGMWGESPLPPERPVVCADAYELFALRRLLPPVESVEAQWPQWQERARNRRAAPAARMLLPESCLVWQEVAMHELQGRLAIPVTGHPLTIELCAEGKIIAARALDGVLPCWGSVSGARVRPDHRWADAILGEETLEALRLRSYKLYAKLARWLGAHEEHPEHARVAALLCEPLVALRRAERAGPLPDPQARLLDGIRWARVLPLANGRRINLYKALEERPGELAHLDLWDAPGHRLQRRYADAKPSADVAGSAAATPASSPSAAAAPAPKPAAASPPTPGPAVAPTVGAAPAPKPSAPPAASPPAAASTPAPPSPTPAPAPPPPRVPTPEERLVDALRAELGLVRQRNDRLLSDEHLDRIHVRPLPGDRPVLVAHAGPEGVIVDRNHPVVRRALAELGRDPVWCTYVASAVYTALNVQLAEITDADERTFLEHLAELAGGR